MWLQFPFFSILLFKRGVVIQGKRSFVMQSRAKVCFLLSLLAGIYSGLLKIALGVWLKDSGFGLVSLGLFGMVHFPYSLKVFWMPFLDTIGSPFERIFQYRKGWIIFLNLIILCILFSFSFFDPSKNLIYFIMLSVFYSCVAATYDSMAVGYQMDTINPKDWGPLEGFFMIAYHSGFWVGGMGSVWLSEYYSWSYVFFWMFLTLSLLTSSLIFMPTSQAQIRKTNSFWEKFSIPYQDFISRNKKIIISLVCFIALYRLQDRILMSMMNYFILDKGFSKGALTEAKTFGMIATIIGGLIGSASVKRIGYKKTLVLGVGWHVISAILFSVQAFLTPSLELLYSAVIFEKMARGFESTVFFTYQMIFCNRLYSTTQLSLLVAIDRFNGGILASFSGFIAKFFGWKVFFLFSFIGSLPSLFFLKRLPGELDEEK
jgi:PAT family beta-lactamase induction signal transducer AmpG